jgi:hypothetical protein
MLDEYLGHHVYFATQEFPRRKHRKKRINKKWRKRYGCYELNMMPHGQIIMMANGAICATKRTWLEIAKGIKGR